MQISGIRGPASSPSASSLGETLRDFVAMLEEAVSAVDTLQQRADEAAKALATGQAQDVHAVMVALEQANLALQLTIQVRNKLVEAYQEIMRMQV
ncbi:MAG: flagellar hook-basal body complex protein FliE [Armatimonadota bacterium]|nr:flagellar hook-basal body complex protein FliE [Armatimonadota bacterium]